MQMISCNISVCFSTLKKTLDDECIYVLQIEPKSSSLSFRRMSKDLDQNFILLLHGFILPLRPIEMDLQFSYLTLSSWTKYNTLSCPRVKHPDHECGPSYTSK